MKKYVLLVLVIVFVITGTAHAAIVNIYATNSSWTNTSIDINSGDLLSIDASGLASYRTAWVTPDGSSQIADSGFAAPGLRKWSLVGRIGSNAPFQVGSSFYDNIYQTGRLYLNFNDDYYYDNSGYWTADINIVPIPAAVWLLGSGIVGLVGIRRRQRS